jgi:hypothetical protein
MPWKYLLLILVLAPLIGCSHRQQQPDLPYRAWHIGLLAPNYMEAWIETVDVVDQRGLVFQRVHGGLPAMQSPPNHKGNPKGWPKRPGSGAGKDLPGIDLPEIIFIRWQSLAEPQTYNVRINIPAWVREEMLKPQRGYCYLTGKLTDGKYRLNIIVGLAPGGIAKTWLSGPCLDPIEISREEGAIAKAGPYEGKSNGEYYFLSDEAKNYIKTYGIPYGSW